MIARNLDSSAVERSTLSWCLRMWQNLRFERVKWILNLIGVIEARQTPIGARSPAQKLLSQENMELNWLFGVEFEKEIALWS